MAEIDSPQSAVDWTEDDRLSFSERWNGANYLNLMRPSAGFEEYKIIRQRTYFYEWFDQIRESKVMKSFGRQPHGLSQCK